MRTQSVGGYFIRAVDLPRFWYYWAHFIDYQTYAFDLLVANDLRGLTFACARGADGACFCDFPSSLVAQGECAVAGEDVLQVRAVHDFCGGTWLMRRGRRWASVGSALRCMR